ncbi:MAG: hypothetical protein ABFD77_06580 [Thermotogota bacterium]
MKNVRRVGIVAAVIAVAVPWMAAAAWKADFTPSTYNPGVGEGVSFAVCEPCLTGGTYTYRWDWNGDGVADVETRDPVTANSYLAAGYYEVQLTIADDTGRRETCRKGILVGVAPSFAVRDVIAQADGSILVVISLRVVEPSSALGFVETLQQGWQVELVDTAGAMTNINAEARKLEVLWGSAFDPGAELVFSYRLYPGYATTISRFDGEMSGYASGVRFVSSVCGVLSLP